MDTVQITLELPEELVNSARQLSLLDSASIAELLKNEIERRQAEAYDDANWEEAVLSEALGDALLPDGAIDFARLNAQAESIPLEELYPEGENDESPNAS